MKVCLISPPKPYLLNPMACPPLGLMTVASVFKAMNYEVEFVDLNKHGKIPEAELYGISITTPDFYTAIEIKRGIEGKVIVGGPHATLCPEECWKHFDFVCCGDFTAVEILPEVLKDCISAVIYGKMPEDIDKYQPDREILDLWDYEFYVDGMRATTMMTAHSCAWAAKTGGCAFCSRYPHPYDSLRYHSVEWVEEEIAEIAEHGFKASNCYDDEFFTNAIRDGQIIELFPEYGIEAWRCFGHSLFILRNKELVKKAAKMGLREVLLGIESGSAKILKLIGKGVTPDMHEKAIKFLHECGIKVKAACIVGLPGESIETLAESWKFYERIEPFIETWDFTVFTPYPGSKIYENPEKYDIRFNPKDVYTAYKGMHAEWKPCRIETSKLSFEQILKARDLLERRFKFNKQEGF